jgi:menaquinone-dependent protoporphyrinogen oxidase
MTVLVVTASRHGSTAEMGEAIAAHLRSRGLDVDFAAPDEVSSLEGYDAVVLGSAVYVGNWLKRARRFVGRHGAELRARRVWLFSSGSIGDNVREAMRPERVEGLTAVTGAVDHHAFAGRLDRGELGVVERLVVRAVKAPDGDHRDWTDVARWADRIAEELSTSPVRRP